jgi:hypothetical protein
MKKCDLCGLDIENGQALFELALDMDNNVVFHAECYEEINNAIAELKAMSELEAPEGLPDSNS